jgi:hypothetical protein
MTDRKKPSLSIKEFLDFAEHLKNDYEYCKALVDQLDKKYDKDLSHDLELKPAKEKNKIATKMRQNRLNRRYYKDILEEFEPLYTMMTDEKYKKTFDMLKQTLGRTRNAEEYHKDRTYYPRVKEKDEIKLKVIA